MPPINHTGRPSPLGLILLAITSVGWGLNFPIMKPVSYTHLTLPTNREV